MRRRAVLIFNPTSGRQRSRGWLPVVRETLREGGYEVEPLPTRGPADATRLAREAARGGDIEVAFAMGGDGTLREVAAGLLGSAVALGPLPAGTTNVLARTLGLPPRPPAAARALVGCEAREIDVGSAGDEPFLMQLSGGLDAAVMARQNSAAKKRFGKAAVAWTALGQWWRYGYPEIELRVGAETLRVGYFAACNIPHYAGFFRMAPQADLRDGLLDLVLFHGRGRAAILGLARDLALGRHVRRADVEVRRVAELEVVGPPELELQLDGDVPPLAPPVSIRVAARRLRVLAPPPG